MCDEFDDLFHLSDVLFGISKAGGFVPKDSRVAKYAAEVLRVKLRTENNQVYICKGDVKKLQTRLTEEASTRSRE